KSSCFGRRSARGRARSAKQVLTWKMNTSIPCWKSTAPISVKPTLPKKSFRFSVIPVFHSAFTFTTCVTEPDRYIFLGFLYKKARFLNLSCNLRHMGRSPGHDEVLRLRKTGMDFFHESPIALSEKIIKELLLKMGRRELHQLQDRLGVYALGMNEHNQVEAINRVRVELFDIHISLNQLTPG